MAVEGAFIVMLWLSGRWKWPLFWSTLGITVGLVIVLNYISHVVGSRLTVTEEGLFISGPTKQEEYLFEDIVAILTEGKGFFQNDLFDSVVLVTADGRKYRFKHLDEGTSLILRPVILTHVAVPIGEKMIRRLQKGSEVKLNDVIVSATGVEHERDFLAWRDMEYAVFKKDRLHLMPFDRREEPLVLPLSTPNLFSLVYILRSDQRSAHGETAEDRKMRASEMFAFFREEGEVGGFLDQSSKRKKKIDTLGKEGHYFRPGYLEVDPELGEILVCVAQKTGPLYAYRTAAAVVAIGGTLVMLLTPTPVCVWCIL